MRLVLLSSIHPSFSHFRAGQTVFASILEALAEEGHQVAYATAGADGAASADTESCLAALGVTNLGAFPLDFELAAGVAGKVERLLSTDPAADRPRFVDSGAAVRALRDFGADAVILFWDTWFESLLPELGGITSVGYLARPRYEAPRSGLAALGRLRRLIVARQLDMQERRSLARLRHLSAASDICALDAAYYTRRGLPCEYLSNTWPDVFGDEWRELRTAAEGRREGLHMIGNIGGLNATGNRFGLQYLAREVLPPLAERLGDTDWQINICGRFDLPADLAASLAHARVAIRGFVDDIDEEVAGNALFLLFNNAGPYTGGYTRVIYAMAAGSCLVAHRRLAESMPELVHGENCLLGGSGAELADHIAGLAADPAQRWAIAERAKTTYREQYAPRHVARRLAELAGGTA